MTQLSFDLAPVDPYALRYFVTHSGVAEAYSVLEHSVQEVLSNPSHFSMMFLCGPSGSGKRHMTQGFDDLASSQGLDKQKIYCVDVDECVRNDTIPEFVSRFEQLKAQGGLLIATSEHLPVHVSSNPHLVSRLSSGSVLRLSYPVEEELRPLILSLLERRNLRLSEKSLQYLLRRLPANPLSFDAIFVKINELSFLQGKPARFGVVCEVVRRDEE